MFGWRDGDNTIDEVVGTMKLSTAIGLLAAGLAVMLMFMAFGFGDIISPGRQLPCVITGSVATFILVRVAIAGLSGGIKP